MGNEAVKLIIALVVTAHGVGHLLFLVPALGIATWAGQTGDSWLLTSTFGEAVTRTIAAVVWAAAIVLFVAGVAGFLTAAEWWRAVTIAGAVVSAVGIVAMWNGIAMSSAVFALGFDAALVIALAVAHWPAADLVGT
ncbi:MAG TPA: hypothetical protein VH720_05105 [Candidatus Limnocylindrales bacterium]|jgi:hypothetical protein